MKYYAWDMGPVPKDLYNELDCPGEDLCRVVFIPKSKEPKEFFGMKPKRPFDDLHFTTRELRLMEKLAEIFNEAKAEHMIEVTHLPNAPWDKTLKEKGRLQEIDYLLALDGSSDSLSLEEIEERLADTKEMKEAFGP